ncbi:MAG: hypothetical protein GY754_43835 [bacterium]|nr:hypothetical protein [bacterium]
MEVAGKQSKIGPTLKGAFEAISVYWNSKNENDYSSIFLYMCSVNPGFEDQSAALKGGYSAI